MCGRYLRRSDKQRIAEAFRIGELSEDFPLPPDYNTAPTTFQPVIRESRESSDREMVLMRWGLIPYFAKSLADLKDISAINARAESVEKSRTWRASFQRRRCLIMETSDAGVLESQLLRAASRLGTLERTVEEQVLRIQVGHLELLEQAADALAHSVTSTATSILLTNVANDLETKVQDRVAAILTAISTDVSLAVEDIQNVGRELNSSGLVDEKEILALLRDAPTFEVAAPIGSLEPWPWRFLGKKPFRNHILRRLNETINNTIPITLEELTKAVFAFRFAPDDVWGGSGKLFDSSPTGLYTKVFETPDNPLSEAEFELIAGTFLVCDELKRVWESYESALRLKGATSGIQSRSGSPEAFSTQYLALSGYQRTTGGACEGF